MKEIKEQFYIVSIDDRKLKFVRGTCEENAVFKCRRLGTKFKVTKFVDVIWFLAGLAMFAGVVLFAGLS